MSFKYGVCIAGAGMLLASCLLPLASGGRNLRIVSWNVQNLFDAEATGEEYDEYNPGTSDWDEEKMRSKMEHLQEVLHALGKDLPDVLLLQEVENRNVLNILNKEYLEGAYAYVDAWKSSDSAIACGILSKIRPLQVHLHFPGEFAKRPLRPVAEIHFEVGGDELILFNNHWKSRRGGQRATEEGRLMASAILAARIRAFRARGYRNLIAAGDFNGSVEDFHPGGKQTAQMPVEALAAAAWRDCLYVSFKKEDTDLSLDETVLYSPWGKMEAPGTYFFQNRWMKLDHFLLDEGLWDKKGLELEEVSCGNLPLASDEEGHPAAWESWRSEGYSDHFPLVLDLTFVHQKQE